MSDHHKELIKCAELARLRVNGESSEGVSKVLSHIEALASVDVEGIEPLTHPHQDVLRQREDIPRMGLTQMKALEKAPEQSDGAFAVPAVLKLSE